jgi:hypothetical protein
LVLFELERFLGDLHAGYSGRQAQEVINVCVYASEDIDILGVFGMARAPIPRPNHRPPSHSSVLGRQHRKIKSALVLTIHRELYPHDPIGQLGPILHLQQLTLHGHTHIVLHRPNQIQCVFGRRVMEAVRVVHEQQLGLFAGFGIVWDWLQLDSGLLRAGLKG